MSQEFEKHSLLVLEDMVDALDRRDHSVQPSFFLDRDYWPKIHAFRSRLDKEIKVRRAARDEAKEKARVLEEQARTIDCSLEPTLDKGWSIHPEDQIKSRVTRKLIMGASNIKLFVDPAQADLGETKCEEVLKRLEDKPVLTANVLDKLLDHRGFIPERQWVGKYVVFFGTIYRDTKERKFVRFLAGCELEIGLVYGWDTGYAPLDLNWNVNAFAAILAA